MSVDDLFATFKSYESVNSPRTGQLVETVLQMQVEREVTLVLHQPAV
jgi:hypothetical protein